METIQAKGKDVTINLKGTVICYDDLGKGRIPIIFIHGFPFDKSSWQPQLEFLKKTHRVIAYDIRGFGKSTAGNEAVSISLFADDLVQFMDALKIEKAIVCGLSMGGYIVLNAVHTYPERFEAIILSDTQCIADTPETKEKRVQTALQIENEGLKDFTEGFIKNVFCQKSTETKKDILSKTKKIILSTSPATLTATLSALAQRHDMCPSLTKIAVPVLILCGKEDAVTPPVQSRFLHSNIPNSILHTIDKAGHMSNLEQPDEFNRYLTYFISGLAK